MRLALYVVSGILVILYPFAVWWGLNDGAIQWVAWLLVLVFLGRLLFLNFRAAMSPYLKWLGVALAFFGLSICALSALLENYQLLLYYPVLINMLLLVLFGVSLFTPMSFVECIARIREPVMPAQAVIYTRRVTQVWCLFFVVNGVLALATCLYGDMQIWVFYNGFLSYMLIALLGWGEWSIRRRFRRRYEHVDTIKTGG